LISKSAEWELLACGPWGEKSRDGEEEERKPASESGKDMRMEGKEGAHAVDDTLPSIDRFEPVGVR
jgi:hypothetical protein